ncbi:putative reverse transcriptase domain-containing protein [Tanacetum coccineum]
MILAPRQPIPYGRPYQYHPNGPLYMLTARKRVGPLPTHHLAMRHSVDYSSSDLFTFDDSSETSSDSSLDDLSDSSSGHSSLDHSSPALPSGMRSSHQLCSVVSSIPHSFAAITERPSHSSSMGPSRKRSRSPTTSVSISSPIPGALSPARADLLPPPKRIRSFDSVTNLEDCSNESSESSVPRENSLRDDVVIRGSDEPYSEPDIDPAIQAEIDEYIAYVDALRAEGIYARVIVETVAREEVKTSVEGPVEVMVDRVMHPAVSGDIPEPAQEEGAIEGIYEMLGDLGHKIIATGQQSVVLSERISELEQDNTRFRGTLDVASKRVTRLQRMELRVQRDEADLTTMPNIRSGATMTREVVNELIDRRVAEALEARDAARNLEPLVEGGGEQEDEDGDDYEGGNGGGNRNGGVNGNGGNGNGGNGNGGVNGNGNGRGNGNGNDNGNVNRNEGGNDYNFGGFMHVARECTYQDFLKCQPLNFNGTEGVCFDMVELANEIQKMEAELWNLTVKGNDLTPYIRRFQELVLLCTRMVPDKEDKVERFIWGLPHNIQGNVIAVEPTKLQDAIRIASKLTDQKLKGYARSAKNKRRFDNNSMENHG